MSTSSCCVGISSMRPCCRILINYKSSSLFGFSAARLNNPTVYQNSSRSHLRLVGRCKFHCSSYNGRSEKECTGNIFLVNPNRGAFCVPGLGLGSFRVFRPSVNVDRSCVKRGILGVPRAAPDIRNNSTSVEHHVNQKGFERIYIQGGLNVNKLAIEEIETGVGVVVEQGKSDSSTVELNGLGVNIDFLKSFKETAPTVDREVSEIEKEAWKLLRAAVVNYCGIPVGTVAASDAANGQPLNYDQVFIRDFVPSALAFLSNGDAEIVKNFLLHTLQLQSWEKTVDCYSPGPGLMPASLKFVLQLWRTARKQSKRFWILILVNRLLGV